MNYFNIFFCVVFGVDLDGWFSYQQTTRNFYYAICENPKCCCRWWRVGIIKQRLCFGSKCYNMGLIYDIWEACISLGNAVPNWFMLILCLFLIAALLRSIDWNTHTGGTHRQMHRLPEYWMHICWDLSSSSSSSLFYNFWPEKHRLDFASQPHFQMQAHSNMCYYSHINVNVRRVCRQKCMQEL